MKNTIEKVWIEKQVNGYPDTSFIGEYTDKKSDWVICRHCGEFVAIAEEGNIQAEYIKGEIVELENLIVYDPGNKNNKLHETNITELEKELGNLILHECPHSSREYNYFKPYASGEPEGSENYITYGKQDFEHMESLNNGNWRFIGIIAKAEIRTVSGIIQTIQSGGLWGIESDSDDSYLEEVGKDELAGLRQELESLGFKENEIDKAFEDVEVRE